MLERLAFGGERRVAVSDGGVGGKEVAGSRLCNQGS